MMQTAINKHVVYLFRFMRLFAISVFWIKRADIDVIDAVVGWSEDEGSQFPNRDDMQEVRWKCGPMVNIDDALALGELAFSAGWIDSDRIMLDEAFIRREMNWDEERSARAARSLLELRATMIDDDEETDMFFLHLP